MQSDQAIQTSSGSLRYVCENWSITRIARQSWGGAFLRIYKLKYFIYSILCGFSIPINVFGKGLSIAHRGTIVVNGKARIGENCRIHACVNIGTVPGVNGVAPTIGDNVYIGPSVCVVGNVVINNDNHLMKRISVLLEHPQGKSATWVDLR